MYETFFGLNRRPFAATPDPACFVATPLVQETFDELVFCVENGQGIAVLTAPAGTGKTLICRKLANELDGTFRTVALGSAICSTRRALLQAILYELQQPFQKMAEQELRLAFFEVAKQLRPEKKAIVLILDEAHLLNLSLLEEIRSVTNLTAGAEPLVRVVLAGQLALEEKLVETNLDSFNQRVRCHVSLQSLTRAESAEYISRRIAWAGGQVADTFTPEAIELVTHASGGIPRCLNQLCDHALLLAYVAEAMPVSGDIIREALADLQQLPLQWNPLPETPERQYENAELGEPLGASEDEERADSLMTSDDASTAFAPDASFESSDSCSFEIGGPEPETPQWDVPAEQDKGGSFEIGAPIDAVESSEDNLDQHVCEVSEDISIDPLESPVMDCPAELVASNEPDTYALEEETPLDVPTVIASDTLFATESEEVASNTEPTDDPLSERSGGTSDSLSPEVLRLEPVGATFEEEVVVDRYAAIDAGEPMHDVSGIVWDIVPEPTHAADTECLGSEAECTNAETQGIDAESQGSETDAAVPNEIAAEDAGSSEWLGDESAMDDDPEDAPLPALDKMEPRPDAIIDEITPLLQKCHDGIFTTDTAVPVCGDVSGCETEVRVVAEEADGFVQIDSSNADTLELPNELTVSGDDRAIEEKIGADVLEICLETQQAITRRLDRVEAPLDLDKSASDSSDAVIDSEDLSFKEVDERTVSDDGVDDVLFDESMPPERWSHLRSSLFDVIEPESAIDEPHEKTESVEERETRPDPGHLGGGSHVGTSTQRPYGRLFSELRRRQRRA